jgi:PAS domain S-box-containing protein
MRPARSAIVRYAVALLATAVALGLALALQTMVNRFPAAFFYAAVAVSAWYGGLGPALLAAVLGLLVVDYVFVEPGRLLNLANPDNVLLVLVFGSVAALIGVLQDRVRRTSQQAEMARASAEAAQASAEAAQATLRESAERFRAVWDSASDAMALSDPQGMVVAANPAYYRLFRYTPEQVIGQNFSLIFPEAQRAEAAASYLSVFAAPERAPAFETIVQRGDGSETEVEARYDFVMRDSQRVAMVSIIRDISERRALERLQQEFIAMVSHDLRNPLTGIKGRAQLMRRRKTYDDRAIEAILAQVDQQERLIDDLLEVSRLEAGGLVLERSPWDLVQEARAAAEQAQVQTDSHTIRFEAPSEAIDGVWDRSRLDRVFANLLTNAVKYSPAGGEIVMRIERRGHEARVSVQDQGVGIAAEALPHLFDRFYRVPGSPAGDAPGLGLGLYIARQLVEAHGGRIWVESDGEGRGSTFRFALPIAPAPG